MQMQICPLWGINSSRTWQNTYDQQEQKYQWKSPCQSHNLFKHVQPMDLSSCEHILKAAPKSNISTSHIQPYIKKQLRSAHGRMPQKQQWQLTGLFIHVYIVYFNECQWCCMDSIHENWRPQSHPDDFQAFLTVVSSWSFGRAEPYGMEASVGFLTFFFPSVFFGFSVPSGSLTSLALAASAFWPALASDLLAFNEPRYSDAWSVKPTSDSRSSARCWALLVLESSLMASSSFGWAPHKITTCMQQAYYIFTSTILNMSLTGQVLQCNSSRMSNQMAIYGYLLESECLLDLLLSFKNTVF